MVVYLHRAVKSQRLTVFVRRFLEFTLPIEVNSKWQVLDTTAEITLKVTRGH